MTGHCGVSVMITDEAARRMLTGRLWGVYAAQVRDSAECRRIVAAVRAVKSTPVGAAVSLPGYLIGGDHA